MAITDNEFLNSKYGELSETEIDTDLWYNYDYANNKSNQKFNLESFLYFKQAQYTNIATYASNGNITNEQMRMQWIDYGSTMSQLFKNIGNVWTTDYSDLTTIDKITTITSSSLSNVMSLLGHAFNAVGLASSQALNRVVQNGASVSTSVEEFIYDKLGTQALSAAETLADTLNTLSENLGKDSVFMSVIEKGIGVFSDGALRTYKNGVDETSFGRLMESSWSKSGTSGFLSLIGKSVYFADSTPLDSGEKMNSLYGKMLLGVPPIFTNITDPKNRAMASTYISDAKFLTLTPGFPQYNGSNMLLATNKDQYHQTTTASAMLKYLQKNGLDEDSFNKDKRYYTFKRDYEEYYTYLETMLNTLWIKMGLGTDDSGKTSMYSFFENPTSASDNKLKSQYQSPIGFFVNPAGALTESIANQQTNFGSSYSGQVNEASETYQQINYLTGMGTGGDYRNAKAITAKTLGLVNNIKDWLKTTAENTVSALRNPTGGIISQIANIAGAVATDARHFTTEVDEGSQMQAFATTNGMKIVYPELWNDSTFSKMVNINFEFVSPYGDPLSIFQYVIVPFCSLLTFAMPRQAADNGYVSPFFIRADIPGMFTSDLAIISDFSWTRGGNSDLWTKDGLPRAISGSFSIQDLYPYLAMTKRISFLSANPNYTTFLDNISGLHAINTAESNNALNDYWKAMLNRVSGGEPISQGLYNKFSSNQQQTNKTYANNFVSSRLGGSTKNNSASPWLRGLK